MALKFTVKRRSGRVSESAAFQTDSFRELADDGFGPGMAHAALNEIDRLRSILGRTQMLRYSLVSASAGAWRCDACGGAPVLSLAEHDLFCDPKKMEALRFV